MNLLGQLNIKTSNLTIWLKFRQLKSEATVIGINFRKLLCDPRVNGFTSDGSNKVAVNRKCRDNRQGIEPKLVQTGSALVGARVAFDRG